MELLPGETLAARVRRGPLSPAEALDVAEDLLAALGALHEAGVVHRDLKPSNIFLTPHGAKLLDFGLAREQPGDVARALATATDNTRPGLIIGTPGYMAPEQILGRPVDARADLFAAGVVLYEALVGQPPFPGENAVQALSRTLYDDPPPLAGTPVLAALDAPIRRAMAKKAAERYGSARDMAERPAGGGEDGRARLPDPGPRGVRRSGGGARAGWTSGSPRPWRGPGSVAFVTGERGVGKTALVGEFLRRVRAGGSPATVVAGRCREAAGPGEAFQPFYDALGRLLTSRGRDQASELLRTYAPTICVQMPAGLMPDPDGSLHRQAAGATKERFIREAGDFMKAAGRGFPIIFFLEDLQWADAASVDMLHHLGCRLARQRMLIVGTFRQADVDAASPSHEALRRRPPARGAARELAVGALTPENVEAYLGGRFPRTAFRPSAAARAARADGRARPLRAQPRGHPRGARRHARATSRAGPSRFPSSG